MIDWLNLTFNALWIVALGLVVAVLSFASWEAKAGGERMRVVLARPRWEYSLNLAGILFCLGLAVTSILIWKQVLWLLLAGLYLFQIGFGIWKRRREAVKK
jgi:hypothetical protein